MSHNEVLVAVDAPLPSALTYLATDERMRLRGTPVIVPLGKRSSHGIVLGPAPLKTEAKYNLKPITGIDEDRPFIPDFHLKFLEWLSDYYVHPLGQVMDMAFAPLNKRENERQKSKKSAIIKDCAKDTPPTLTDEQTAVLNKISLDSFQVHLVHGVTGSGKTEIYLHLLDKVLQKNEQGLLLVPEIALTPQLIDRFARRFGQKIAVIHSHLTDRERTEQWWQIYNGEKQILVGARSALFCPVPKLGLILIDEEHEPSYKQEESLKYHARDAAIVLAKQKNIPIILGSATPSLESYHNAKLGKYHYHEMKSRVGLRSLPQITIVNLRESQDKPKRNPFWLSEELNNAIKKTLDNHEQVALFLNRRGVAQTVLCGDCGFVHRCPNCSITLTLHGKTNLVCHYCDFATQLKENCPDCRLGEIKPLGLGTELLENDLKNLFPDAKIMRADRDEISSREDYEDLVQQMESGAIDILVGTQMIAKGLDFPRLTLVGLVLADVGFNMPDFRSSERNYQLVTQMSGRSGRHVAHGGLVFVQTYNPDYPGLNHALNNDYHAFAEQELKLRQELLYPPFGRLAGLRIQAHDIRQVENLADKVSQRAESLKTKNPIYESIQILGPAQAPLFKLRNRYRYHMLLKSTHPMALSAFCRQLMGDQKWIPAKTKVQVDIDPVSLL